MEDLRNKMHYHLCQTCGQHWKHDGSKSVDSLKEHTCTQCGQETWFWMTEEELQDELRRFTQPVRPQARPARRAAQKGFNLPADTLAALARIVRRVA